MTLLHHLAMTAAQRTPEAVAVKGPDGSLSYGALDALANQIGRALAAQGVTRGDRVGIWLDKSTQAVAAMQAILRLGAAYVPVDPLSPVARATMILNDCGVRALVSTTARMAAAQGQGLGEGVAALRVDGEAWGAMSGGDASPLPPVAVGAHELAYILYTSGSTGKPKGVCISHRNALAFVEWSIDLLGARYDDRFANHAPFHFDLSVLDIYAAFGVGAAVCLIPDVMSYVPERLVDFIRREEITIWYSVPSVLVMMMEGGGLLELPVLPLRAILFAGEPFPIKPLRRLYERWGGHARFLNLYGPTETNVCTFYEVHEIDPERTKPVPIGQAASGDEVWAVTEGGTRARPGEEGELWVAGPTVMLGYWGQPPQGERPYATGDLVLFQEDGHYMYLGRRDHMVKVRGYRIELGEIEAALETHPEIHEAAAVVAGEGVDARIIAFLVSPTPTALPLLQVKRHCAEHLPRYMIVDDVLFCDELPRTRNGKVDRRHLQQEATTFLNHRSQRDATR